MSVDDATERIEIVDVDDTSENYVTLSLIKTYDPDNIFVYATRKLFIS